MLAPEFSWPEDYSTLLLSIPEDISGAGQVERIAGGCCALGGGRDPTTGTSN
jgi:hypothetical protein